MKLPFLFPSIAAALWLSACATTHHAMKDSEQLIGTWNCVSATVDGKPLPPETCAQLRLTLTADRYRTEKGTQVLFDSSYTIDPARTPKEIQMLGTEGDLAGKEALGIYQLNGADLLICYTMPGFPRPARFESPAGSKAYLISWRRAP